MKRKLIVEEWLSLDGYVSDKMGKLDFFAKYVRESYTSEKRVELLSSIDTILFGRKTYELFSALWPERPIESDLLAEKMNTLNKIVFSNSLEKASWGTWVEATTERAEPAKRITELKSESGKNMVLWASISIAQTLMEKNLIDEYHLHICPVITGGGRRFFGKEMEACSLKLLEAIQIENGVLLLKYEAPENSNI